jgi:antirestriction protein ArdC
MKRDLYSEVSARIIAELEAGATPWTKPWSITPGANTPCNAVTNRPYSGCNVILLWMAKAAGYRTPRFLTFKQALDLAGHVRKGERGTKVYFVKQLEIREDADDGTSTRLIPMLREYTVFNVEQCERLPENVTTGRPFRVRNPDTRDELADDFLRSTGADIRRGTAKRVTRRTEISSPCLRSRRSRARITSTVSHSMS